MAVVKDEGRTTTHWWYSRADRSRIDRLSDEIDATRRGTGGGLVHPMAPRTANSKDVGASPWVCDARHHPGGAVLAARIWPSAIPESP